MSYHIKFCRIAGLASIGCLAPAVNHENAMPLLLTRDSLGSVAPDVAVPRYAFDALSIGIVHLGIGAFHRAHQAVYTSDAIARAGGAWGICGVSLRSPD